MFKLFLIFALSIGVSVAQVTEQVKSIFNQKNILQNPGYESAFSKWTRSGGAWSIVTSGSNLGYGNISLTFNASSAANYLESALVTIPNGFAGIPLEGSCRIKTPSGTATHLLQIRDSSSNILSSVSVRSSTTFRQTIAQVASVSEGAQIRIRIQPVAADEPLIAIDDCYLGPATNIGTVAQATFYGGMTQVGAAGCSYSENTSSGFSNFVSLGTGSGCNAWTTSGVASAVGTNDHRVTLSSLPRGEYEVLISAATNASTAGACVFRLSDGTNTYGTNVAGVSASTDFPMIRFRMSRSSDSGSTTLTVQASDNHAGGCGLGNADPNVIMNWTIYRFPTSSETVYQANTTAWKVDANISGANISQGTGNVSSYTGIENGSLTLTNNSGQGNIAAQIPCSSTNAPSGTTCSSGNESVGVSFTPPGGWTGDVLACVSFSRYWTLAASSSAEIGYQIVETPNNAQTISQEGKTRINHLYSTPPSSISTGVPMRVCGNFTISSSSQKTLRLMYEMIVNAGTVTANEITADGNATVGQRDIHWEVYPINQGVPAPVFIGSVTSNSSGAERVERLSFSGGSDWNATACTTGNCTINSQSGSWVSTVAFSSTGTYNVNVPSGIFSAVPTCTCNALLVGTGNGSCLVNYSISTATQLRVTVGNGTTATNGSVNLECQGPR